MGFRKLLDGVTEEKMTLITFSWLSPAKCGVMHGEGGGAAMKKEDQVGMMVRGMGPDSDQKTKKEQPEQGASLSRNFWG